MDNVVIGVEILNAQKVPEDKMDLPLVENLNPPRAVLEARVSLVANEVEMQSLVKSLESSTLPLEKPRILETVDGHPA